MANFLNGTTYIVILELGAGHNISAIETILKSSGTWAKITPTSWAIVSMTDKASAIRDRLIPLLGVGGRAFVIKSGYESAWKNVIATNDWLGKYLEN